MIKSTAYMNVSDKCGVGVAPNKSGVGVNLGTYSPLFSVGKTVKKILRQPIEWVALEKTNKTNMVEPIFNELNFNGLTYAVKCVKGVFHMLNLLVIGCSAPMFSVLGQSKCLVLSSLNLFLGSSKNSFLLV